MRIKGNYLRTGLQHCRIGIIGREFGISRILILHDRTCISLERRRQLVRTKLRSRDHLVFNRIVRAIFDLND